MKKSLILFLLILSGCSSYFPPDQQHLVSPTQIANKQEMIELQNPVTRDIAICKRDGRKTAEECAKIFEEQGFVKLRNIPYKPAKYDDLRTDSYPTRKWRDEEKTPRW